MTAYRSILITAMLLLSLALLSCATGGGPVLSRGPNIEGLLVEAGFVRNPADTPEKVARIRKEVQRKVIPVQEEEETYYLYADADFCRCLYAGDEAAFSRFEELVKQRGIERSSCIDTRLRSVQAEPWREFGPLHSLCSDRP